jgi:Peptidase family S41
MGKKRSKQSARAANQAKPPAERRRRRSIRDNSPSTVASTKPSKRRPRTPRSNQIPSPPLQEAKMDNTNQADRVAWLETAMREIGQICLKLGSANVEAQATVAQAAPPPPAVSATNTTVPGGPVLPGGVLAPIPLSTFLTRVTKLTPADRLTVVDAAIAMLAGVFVHLPLKKAMHGIDPVQRLKLLRYRLATEIASNTISQDDRGFHDEMIDVFHSLRDLHTNYILPRDYQGRTAFLPFLMEEYFDNANPRQRHYIVTKTRGLNGSTFKVGVKVTHWNGIPIARAVELNAAREAGSNPDARQARGLEALTLRPMGLTAPPDEAWVVIGYESSGQAFECRFEWQVIEPPPIATGVDVHDPTADFGEAAFVLGFDAETEAVRRARKSIFDQPAMEREQQMAEIMTAAELPQVLGGVQATTAEFAGPSSFESRQSRGGKSKRQFGSAQEAQHVMNEAAARYKSRSQVPAPQPLSFEVGGAAVAAGPSSTSAGTNPPPPTTDIPSVLPDCFGARSVTTASGTFGYIRMYSFMVYDANAFVAEFARLAQLLPQNGLIVDVRKNGGGNIIAGEKVLQVLSPAKIEVERFHFINTPATITLCGSPALQQWLASVEMSIATGEIYSQGFPLTQFGPQDVTYRYPGKKLLIIDALCYSTTDIFAAGFQDNRLGKILGTAGRTGAGGANVWTYDFFQALPGFIPMPLPGGVSFRTAIRRSTRVGDQAGVPLEDLGVQPDDRHYVSLRDVTEGNVELIEQAAKLLTTSP